MASHMSQPQHASAGITLLEVLIATAILSIALLAAVYTFQHSTQSSEHIQRRGLALRCAQHQMIAWRAAPHTMDHNTKASNSCGSQIDPSSAFLWVATEQRWHEHATDPTHWKELTVTVQKKQSEKLTAVTQISTLVQVST